MKKTYHIELMDGANLTAVDMATIAAFANGGKVTEKPLFEGMHDFFNDQQKNYPFSHTGCILSQEDHKLVMYRDGKTVMVIEEREEFELPTLPAKS